MSDETAAEIIAAVEATFGPLGVDLACSRANAKAPKGLYSEAVDSLTVDWHKYLEGTIGWLNPPAGDQYAWSLKCASEAIMGARMLYITEAALDTASFWGHIHPHAAIYLLHPRITYDGRPVPLMIAAFNVLPLMNFSPPPAKGSLNLWLWEQPTIFRGTK